MVLTMAYDEAKHAEIRRGSFARGKGIMQAPFFGSRNNESHLPLATLNTVDPGFNSTPHFHDTDEFQIVLKGKGKLGRHSVSPYSVHFARAYTPYGPVISDDETGISFFVIRAHPDSGPQRVPEELDVLKGVPERDPWQTIATINSWPQSSGMGASGVTMQSIPGFKNDRGLAGYTLTMAADETVAAPDPSLGDGQCVAILAGSAVHEGKELKAPALIYVLPKDGSYRMQAGSQGLQGIILNFPSKQPVQVNNAGGPSLQAGATKRQCALCAFAYDEAQGLPEDGIAAGTRWEDIPDTWSCPDCNASKSDFQVVGI